MNKTLSFDSHILSLVESHDRLIQEMQITVQEMKKISHNLEDLERSDFGNVDLLPGIKSSFNENRKLNRRQIKFFLLNLGKFEIPTMKWFFEIHQLNPSLIERNLLFSWYSFSQFQNEFLDIVNANCAAPSFLENWFDLANERKMRDFADQKLAAFFSEQYIPPVYALRSFYFRLMIADFCFRYFDEQTFLNFLNKLEKLRLSSLHPIELIKNQATDKATKYMAATFLKFFREGRPNSLEVSVFLLNFKPNFGDPRSVGHRWGEIQEIEPDGFQNWLASLNEEDIVFFFDNLEKVIHPERRSFWLKFIKRANRIAVVLDNVQREKLKIKFQDSEKMLQIINRSFRFRSEGSSSQQLIIYFFKGYVIVEGSSTGFACQIFEEHIFRKNFESSFYKENGQIINEFSFTPFRNDGIRFHKLNHTTGWEFKFLNELSQLGIFPDGVDFSSASAKHQEDGGFFDHATGQYFPGNKKSSKRDGGQNTSSNKGDNVVSVQKFNTTFESTHPLNNKGLGNYLKLILESDGEIIDQRHSGHLWIIYDNKIRHIIDNIQRSGIIVKVAPGGSKATSNRVAWYIEE